MSKTTKKENNNELQGKIAEFQEWWSIVSEAQKDRLVMDAFWKADQPFEESEIVRFFRLHLKGADMRDKLVSWDKVSEDVVKEVSNTLQAALKGKPSNERRKNKTSV